MAEPVTSSALGGMLAGAALANLANQFGVPVPMLLTAAIGATVAVSAADRIAWTARGILAGLTSFVMSMTFGVVVGGQFFGSILQQGLAKVGFHVAFDVAASVVALIFSLQGQSIILPAIGRRFGVEVEKRGAPQ